MENKYIKPDNLNENDEKLGKNEEKIGENEGEKDFTNRKLAADGKMRPTSLLTEKMKMFADEYLSNGNNGTQAYITIYKTTNYQTANRNAARHLKNPEIQAYFASKKSEIARRNDIRREDIVDSLRKILKKSENDNDTYHFLKALDMLNKMAGFYVTTPAINLNTSGEIKIDFGGHTLEENPVKSIDISQSNDDKDNEDTDFDDVSSDI